MPCGFDAFFGTMAYIGCNRRHPSVRGKPKPRKFKGSKAAKKASRRRRG